MGMAFSPGIGIRVRGSTVSPVSLSPNNPLSPAPKKVIAKPEAI